MELALNFFWLLTALGSLCLWLLQRPHWPLGWRQDRHLPHPLACLIFALVLFFPAISLTDDFQRQQAILQKQPNSDWPTFKRWDTDEDDSTSSQKTVAPAELVLPQLSAYFSRVVGWLAPGRIQLGLHAVAGAARGRAPPSSDPSSSC